MCRVVWRGSEGSWVNVPCPRESWSTSRPRDWHHWQTAGVWPGWPSPGSDRGRSWPGRTTWRRWRRWPPLRPPKWSGWRREDMRKVQNWTESSRPTEEISGVEKYQQETIAGSNTHTVTSESWSLVRFRGWLMAVIPYSSRLAPLGRFARRMALLATFMNDTIACQPLLLYHTYARTLSNIRYDYYHYCCCYYDLLFLLLILIILQCPPKNCSINLTSTTCKSQK